MERGHYNGYRGRTATQKVLLGFVCVLAVLVVLMALVLLLGQRYIYYSADGVHLDLPFLNSEPAPAPDVSDVVVEILPPAPQEPDVSQPTQEEITDPAPPDASVSAGQESQTE